MHTAEQRIKDEEEVLQALEKIREIAVPIQFVGNRVFRKGQFFKFYDNMNTMLHYLYDWKEGRDGSVK